MGIFSRDKLVRVGLSVSQFEAISRGEEFAYCEGGVIVVITTETPPLAEPPSLGVDDFECGDYTRVDSVEKLKISEVWKENDRLKLEVKALKNKLMNVAEAITNG